MAKSASVHFRAAIEKRAATGFDRLAPAAGVKLEIANLQGEVHAVFRIGCDGQSAACKRDRLVLPEERILILRSGKVGARRSGVGSEVEMLGP
jgi:hypothetical protein